MVDEGIIVVPILIVMWGWKVVVKLAANDLIYVKRISCGKFVIVYTIKHRKKKLLLKGIIERET